MLRLLSLSKVRYMHSLALQHGGFRPRPKEESRGNPSCSRGKTSVNTCGKGAVMNAVAAFCLLVVKAQQRTL